MFPWSKPDNDESRWEKVSPGERDTPKDRFDSFSYWVPAESLLDEVKEDAEEAAKNGLPDVESPGVLDEPDGLTRLRHLVIDACHGRRGAAVDLFSGTRVLIATHAERVVREVSSSTNAGRAAAQLQRDLIRLAEFEVEIEELEDALNARLGALVSHFEYLSSEYTHELKKHHEYADLLEIRWEPTPLVLSPAFSEFGQEMAREQIRNARAAADKRKKPEATGKDGRVTGDERTEETRQ